MASNSIAESCIFGFDHEPCGKARSDKDCSQDSCDGTEHPNISTFTATLIHRKTETVEVQGILVDSKAMRSSNSIPLEEQCDSYTESRFHEAQAYKLSDYLSHPQFSAERRASIDTADWILFFEAVEFENISLGYGLAMLTLDWTIERLNVGAKCVVVMQRDSYDCCREGKNRVNAWEKMGFASWTGEFGWVSLLTGERPKLEDAVPGLFQAPGQGRDDLGERLEALSI